MSGNSPRALPLRGIAACLSLAALLGGCSTSALPPCMGDGCALSPDFGAATLDLSNPATASDLSATDPATLCGEMEGQLHFYSTEAELLALLVGRWALCSGKPLGAFDTFGLEFAADGHWYALQRDGAGHIVRAPDPGEGRGDARFNAGAAGAFFVTNARFSLVFEDGGRPTLSVAFEDAPRRMALDPSDADERIYAAF